MSSKENTGIKNTQDLIQLTNQLMKTVRTSPGPSTIPTLKESADVDKLVAVMGGELSPEVALTVLRANHGDVEKAALAFLEGDFSKPQQAAEAGMSGSGPRTPPPSKPENSHSVIDLTADDEDKELSRALAASLEDQAPHFGPSNRAPDPNWAVVPSNVEVGVGMSQDDQFLSRAIEASLSYDFSNEIFEELPLEERVRKDGRPVALRPTQPTLAYAGLILHGLFYVPQVRHAVARWHPRQNMAEEDGVEAEGIREMSPPTNGPSFIAWSLLELFANMDLAQLSELNVDAVLTACKAEFWSSPVERPGDVSFQFYNKLARTAEEALYEEPADEPTESSWSRLFHFRYGFSDAEHSNSSFDRRMNISVVKVDVRGTDDMNDLVSCLSAELSLTGVPADPSKQQVIFDPSGVVAFQLLRDGAPPSYSASQGSGGRAERRTFGYPKHVYLDQFLKENLALANEKRARQRGLLAEVEQLALKKNGLMRFNDRDVLADLRSALHYYEHVAEHNDDPQRNSAIQAAAIKLRKTLTQIENEIQTIDVTTAKLRSEAANVFECPELQQHRYDLRVVLVHDGLFGRSHLYSYVKHNDTWWKTVDYAVTEVIFSRSLFLHSPRYSRESALYSVVQVSEEVVLTDSVGLHLGAGPYFLIYSRALSEDEEHIRAPWPEGVKNSVKHNNKMFLSQLPPEVAAQVIDPNSPPSSPYVSATPSEYTMSSGTVEPPLSREEPMDLVD
ncbi:hypothetical protein AcV7_001167 [Taiwanofungus camphoratus]|nr:hypothetical protein AcV7_001167 [Antrodia cinnamomea]